MRADRTLLKTRRRLERAELAHLRVHCAEQAARIEALELELERAIDDANAAFSMACVHQDAYYELLERIPAGVPAPVIGITREGEVGVVEGGCDAH